MHIFRLGDLGGVHERKDKRREGDSRLRWNDRGDARMTEGTSGEWQARSRCGRAHI